MPRDFEEWVSLALWLAGAGHFCVLMASFQVPFRLRWKEDLAKLTSFNRKLMWVHGGFTVYTILAFGAMSLLLLKRCCEATAPRWLSHFSSVFIGSCASSLILLITLTRTGPQARPFV